MRNINQYLLYLVFFLLTAGNVSGQVVPASVDLKVNGQDGMIFVPQGTPVVVSWTSHGIVGEASCTNNFNGNKASSSLGEEFIYPSFTGSKGYSIRCIGPDNVRLNDSVGVFFTSKYNPYLAPADLSAMKNWFVNQTPISIKEQDGQSKTYTTIPASQRQYIDFSVDVTLPGPFMPLTNIDKGVSGCWDDVYASLDQGHSGLISWLSTEYNVRETYFMNQLINIPRGNINANNFAKLGVNFTSQSEGYRGHQMSNSPTMVFDWEFFSYAQNVVRSSPAYLSYVDASQEKVVDSYDGLFSHVLNSLGQSNSEMNGIAKMSMAAGALPRATKNLLKSTGNFAPAMFYIYKSTLPYVDAQGNPLPYENELFHRVAYLTDGQSTHPQFFPLNQTYHQYSEGKHLYQMTRLASQMKEPMPFVVLNLLGRSVMNKGRVVISETDPEPSGNDAYVQTVSKTQIRIWGRSADVITLRIDLTRSYDLLDKKLIFKVVPLYPEQKNVTITEEAYGKYRIVATHDPHLPKGRIPIIVTAFNGTYSSNPAFINFYWPEPGQSPVPTGYFTINASWPRDEVNRNLRPKIITEPSIVGLTAAVNKPVRINLSCTDPEGYPTRWYRWADEGGVLSEGVFEYSPTVAMEGKTKKFHFICSDGTGGYNSIEIPVQVLTGGVLALGDVNGDGVITAHDACMVARYSVGSLQLTEAQIQRAKVSNDSAVTIEDAMWIMKKALNLIQRFPAE